jgi:phenylacetaldehyde dehydrogenase
MVNRAGKIKVGHGLDPSVQLGPLVSKEQHTKVAGYIESGRKEGVKVETGGGVIGNQGYFVEPTVLTKTKSRHARGQGGDFRPGRMRAVVR